MAATVVVRTAQKPAPRMRIRPSKHRPLKPVFARSRKHQPRRGR